MERHLSVRAALPVSSVLSFLGPSISALTGATIGNHSPASDARDRTPRSREGSRSPLDHTGRRCALIVVAPAFVHSRKAAFSAQTEREEW
jgi:hypothetical protein